MRSMRKVSIIALSAAMAFSVFGCSSNTEKGAVTESSKTEASEVTTEATTAETVARTPELYSLDNKTPQEIFDILKDLADIKEGMTLADYESKFPVGWSEK